jgi:hypothetical protein
MRQVAADRGWRRFRKALKWLGGSYLVYHALVAALLMASFLIDTRSGYWRDAGAVGELALMMVLYPLFIPALVVSGGPHNFGGGPLVFLTVPVLLLTVVAAGSGVWLAVKRFRRTERA